MQCVVKFLLLLYKLYIYIFIYLFIKRPIRVRFQAHFWEHKVTS